MSGLPRESGPFRFRLRPVAAALVAMALLVAGSLGINAVGAQSIDDARAEAEALAADLASTQERLIELAEEYNRATADLETAKVQVAAAQKQLEANQAVLDRTRAQLRDYALQAYVSGGGERELDGFFGADANTVDQRLNYIKTAAGNKKQLLDDVAEASKRVDRQLAQMQLAQKAAEAEQARIDRAQAEAGQLEAETADLLEQANGRLATLVAEAEARREAQEREAALAAARAAQIQVQVQSENTTSAGSSGGGSGSGGTTPPPPVVYTPPPGLRAEAAIAVQAAMSQIGVPYVFGGASPSAGFDCSGLMYWAYAQAGVSISRPADYQRDDSVRISYEDLQPGDLVFYGEPPSHVGMYIGNDEIVNAPRTGEVVSVKNMFYSSKPMTYGRIV